MDSGDRLGILRRSVPAEALEVDAEHHPLYFAVRTSDRTYCANYETFVLDQIDDLFSAQEKDVKVVFKGKSLTLTTPKVSEGARPGWWNKNNANRAGRSGHWHLLAALIFLLGAVPVCAQDPFEIHVYQCLK
jgi:hypothetical protein